MQTYFISQLAIFQKSTIIKEETFMATQVRFEDVFSYDGSLWFRFGDGEAFSVKSLNAGVMVIDIMVPWDHKHRDARRLQLPKPAGKFLMIYFFAVQSQISA